MKRAKKLNARQIELFDTLRDHRKGIDFFGDDAVHVELIVLGSVTAALELCGVDPSVMDDVRRLLGAKEATDPKGGG